MSETKRCPHCGSHKTSTSLVGGVEEVGAGLLAGITAGLTGLVSPSHASHVAHTVMHGVPHQYKCEKCGHTWHE